MLKLTEVAPAGMVTVVGTVIWALSLPTRVTVKGAVVLVFRVTVP
jgi:hypothetical protein